MGLSLRGQSSGAIDINAPNAAGNNTITLPGSNGAANQFYKNSGTAGTLTHSLMIEDSNGNIGIGTDAFTAVSSGRQILEIEGSSGSLINFAVDGARKAYHFTDGNDIYSYNTVNGNYIFGTSDTEKVRITGFGSFGIGDNDPKYKLSVKDTKADGTGVQLRLWNNSVDNTAGNVWSGIKFTGSTADYETAEIKGWRVHPGTGLNSLSINTGGVERMVLSSSGVGIGITNPEKELEVSSSSSPTIRINNSDGSISADQTIGAIEFKANDGSGDGSQVTGSIESIAEAAFTGQGSPSHLIFKTNGTSGADALAERFRITHDGKLNFAATGNIQSSLVSVNGGNYGVTNCFAARVANDAYFNYVGVAPGNAINFVVYGTGNVENSNNSYGTYSDIKLKENIVDAGSQWDDFKAVRFRKFNFKEETGFETHTQLGVIAQELELTSPNLVVEKKDLDSEMNETGTTTKSVKTSILTMKAIVALQEAMTRIETLEAEVAALKGS